MYGPVIEGKLVGLRPPRPEDLDQMVKWFEDMEVTRFLKLRFPPGIEAEKEWLEKTARDPNLVHWVVEYEGRAVGGTGIYHIDWKYGIGHTGTAIGDKSAWRKGLGRELMQLRTEYAFTQLPLRKLESSYYDGNDASARAQAAAGYREIGRRHAETFIDGEWRDEVLTELLREDWERSRKTV